MNRFAKVFLMAILVLAGLTILTATPARADEAPVPAPAAQAGCQPTLDLNALAGPAEAAVCPAPEPAAKALPATPDFITVASRTCRCSCGFPCKTDADCGLGGRCTAGITCC
jgi:hypothetical protein